MVDYLNPWQRKIGVVMQVVTLLFAACWGASFCVPGEKIYQPSMNLEFQVESRDGVFYISSVTKQQSPAPGYRGWNTGSADTQLEWFSFRFVCSQNNSTKFGVGLLLFGAPYWSVTVPLALVSAWLLLRPWRRSVPKPAVESGPEPTE